MKKKVRVLSAEAIQAGAIRRSQKKAAKSILELAGKHLPRYDADADEPRDPVELVGFSACMSFEAVVPTECLREACPFPSETCDCCEFRDKNDDEEMYPVEFATKQPVTAEFRSRNDAKSLLYELAPASRGHRARAELHVRLKL